MGNLKILTMVDVCTVDMKSFELLADISTGQRASDWVGSNPSVEIQLPSLILKNWN
jgi:hypothetical protein